MKTRIKVTEQNSGNKTYTVQVFKASNITSQMPEYALWNVAMFLIMYNLNELILFWCWMPLYSVLFGIRMYTDKMWGDYPNSSEYHVCLNLEDAKNKIDKIIAENDREEKAKKEKETKEITYIKHP